MARLVGARARIPDVAVFDPAVPERAVRPERVFDLLINVDVLEHVPDEEIDAVVAEMADLDRGHQQPWNRRRLRRCLPAS